METSREFAGWFAKETINRLTHFKEGLTEAQKIELEMCLLATFYAGLKYDPEKNKIPEKV